MEDPPDFLPIEIQIPFKVPLFSAISQNYVIFSRAPESPIPETLFER